MLLVVQPVDDRNGRVAGQFPHVLMLVRPVHDTIDVAAEHPRGVRDRLAAPDLEVVWA